MLTVTLRGLERDGIVSLIMYPVMPPRVDDELTPLGRTFWMRSAP
jgi:DNA-binding HxlR family transcriptional regulator